MTTRTGRYGWILAALLSFTFFQTFGARAQTATPPAQDAPSGERISQDGMVDLDAGPFEGLLNRLNLPVENFGVSKPGEKTPEGKVPEKTPAKKEEEEPETPATGEKTAAAGDGNGELDLASLQLTEAQVSAVEQAIAEGVDLTAFTTKELEEFGFTGEQVTEFERLVKEAAQQRPAGGTDELASLGLNEEQRAAVEKILTAKSGAAKPEELAKLKTDLDAANAEKTRLETELKQKGPQTAVSVAQMHPVFTLDAGQLAQRERECMDFERWAMEHWDGVEETAAEGDKPAQPAVPASVVRKRYSELQQERQTWIPRARAVLEQQRQQDALAFAAYPALKDAKSAESQLVETILKRAPGLAAIFPNARMIIADAIEGERARMAKAKTSKTGTNGSGLKLKVGNGAKVAPKLPMSAKPGKPGAATRTTKPSDTLDEKAFAEMKSGGITDRDALVSLIGKTNLAARN